MDFSSAEDWLKLGTAERLEHCRKSARDAESHAATANPPRRDFYNRLAAQWRKLAAEIEREAAV